MVHFQGKCSYVLAKNCGDGDIDFRIIANNENRYGNMDMSWTRNVYIVYGQTKIEVKKALCSHNIVSSLFVGPN